MLTPFVTGCNYVTEIMLQSFENEIAEEISPLSNVL